MYTIHITYLFDGVTNVYQFVIHLAWKYFASDTLEKGPENYASPSAFGGGVPGRGVPGRGVPASIPGGSVPGGSVPGSGVPSGGVPGGVPGGSVPASVPGVPGASGIFGGRAR